MAVPAFQPWYERHPVRFAEERADMEARGFALDAAALAQGVVRFEGMSQTAPVRPLQVVYPDAFPSAPPMVLAPPAAGLLRRHQRPDSGELCLFGRKQSRWSADRPGTAALDEAEIVLSLFVVGAPAVDGDDVPEPPSDTYCYDPRAAALVLPGVAALEPTVPVGAVGSFRFRLTNNLGGRVVVNYAALGGQTARDELSVPGVWGEGKPQTGILVYLAAAPPYLEDRVAFEAWVRQTVPSIEKKGRLGAGWYAFLFPEEAGTRTEQRLAWLLVEVRVDRSFRLVRTYTLRPTEREARVPGLARLAEKKVVVVGCGSLGAKIAVALAATGVGRFGLVDPERFEPPNTIRHEAGFEAVGVSKVQALAARIQSIHPLPESHIEMLQMKVGGLNGPRTERGFHELLASADLVVDTTAAHAVARHLRDICHDQGVPSLHATVTNGAWGGELVRVLPGQTACWLCWFAQYEHDRAPEAPAPPAGVFAPGCAQPTFTGTTYEVGMVANLAAWAAVETLLREESDRPAFPGNYVRWRGRTDAGLPLAAAEFLPTEVAADCPFCNPA